MEIIKDYKLRELAKEHGMKEFFHDCYELKVSENEIMEKLFYLLMSQNQKSNNEFWKKHPEASNDDLTQAIDIIIKELNLDVNNPCYSERQDMMYHAVKYGTAKDVEMLLTNGYNGSNSIGGHSAYYHLYSAQIDKEEKAKLLETYGLNAHNPNPPKLEDYSEAKKKQATNIKFLDHKQIAKIANLNQYSYSILQRYIGLNTEKATTKLVDKLLGLNASMEELKNVFQYGTFYDHKLFSETGETKPCKIYYKLLESERIPHSKEKEDILER